MKLDKKILATTALAVYRISKGRSPNAEFVMRTSLTDIWAAAKNIWAMALAAGFGPGSYRVVFIDKNGTPTANAVRLEAREARGEVAEEDLLLSNYMHAVLRPVREEAKAVHWQDAAECREPLIRNTSEAEIRKVCSELADFLVEKNQNYGDSALVPLRVCSKADPVEQIKVRMDDKLSRLVRGQAGGEDALKDLVGYWVLLQVAEQRACRSSDLEKVEEELQGIYVGAVHNFKTSERAQKATKVRKP